MPGHLAGTMGFAGHHSTYVAAVYFSRVLVVAIFICVAFFIVLLACAVFGETLAGFFGTAKAKTARTAFFVGLGVLLAGIVVGVQILDVIGGCLIGAVLLGTILENY